MASIFCDLNNDEVHFTCIGSPFILKFIGGAKSDIYSLIKLNNPLIEEIWF